MRSHLLLRTKMFRSGRGDLTSFARVLRPRDSSIGCCGNLRPYFRGTPDSGLLLVAIRPYAGRIAIAWLAQGLRRRAVGNRANGIVDVRLDLLPERERGFAFTV